MSTAAIYRAVIDEVIKNVREEFLREGVDESILMLLQQSWELKLAQENVAFSTPAIDTTLLGSLAPLMPPFPAPAGRGAGAPAPAPAARLPGAAVPHFSPTSVVHMPPQRVTAAQPLSAVAPAAPQPPAAQHATYNFLAGAGSIDGDDGRLPSFSSPSQFTPPATWTPQAQQAANAAARGTKNVPPESSPGAGGPPQKRQQVGSRPGVAAPAVGRQADGASDEPDTENDRERRKADEQLEKLIAGVPLRRVLSGQADGPGDDDEDDDDPLANLGQPGKPGGGSQDSGLEKLDDDLDSELDDEEDQEPATDHLVLCQFEKVTRVKNKRKCNLKDGIMMLNNKEYLFHRATGEFDW